MKILKDTFDQMILPSQKKMQSEKKKLAKELEVNPLASIKDFC
jgi:hypothetical protein